MTYSVKYIPKVYEDLRGITKWYYQQRPGLNDEFLLSLEAAILFVKRSPFQFQEKILGTREILLRRFPFRIVYRIYESDIIVLGIFHTKRNPKLIWKRIK